MKVTVKEFIEKLHDYPAEAEIAIEDIEDDQEYFIISFAPGDNKLTIVISSEEEDEEEEGG
jgi:hypothetical protein